MACFLVPMTEAIIMTIVKRGVEKKEQCGEAKISEEGASTAATGLTWSAKLGWLNKMLWGGTALLALEHIWHGEVVPWPPFLTAINNPANIAPMLHEIATVGTAMAVFVTAVWAVVVMVADHQAKMSLKKAQSEI